MIMLPLLKSSLHRKSPFVRDFKAFGGLESPTSSFFRLLASPLLTLSKLWQTLAQFSYEALVAWQSFRASS